MRTDDANDIPSDARPRVSVLMPTFKQAAFIGRALESLRAQEYPDWELVIVDDGSPDETRHVLAPYLAPDSDRFDPRLRYHRLARNGGLGAALNIATGLARGRYLAYLPSDDLYYPDHLARLVALLDARPEIGLAYNGVRWGYRHVGPTLHGAGAVGREAEALADPPPVARDAPLAGGNLFALVQVVHRRDWEDRVRWVERAEGVSDRLEPDFWRALLAAGARTAYSGAIGCEWVGHPDQRHKIIDRLAGGLARYRQHYDVGHETWMNWRPSRGMHIDERERWGRFARDAGYRTSRSNGHARPADDGLKILLVGSLGFNPERIVAFEERGHKLYGLWRPRPGHWDASGPFPWGDIEDVPFDRSWPERVRAIQPDVIYAGINWESVPFIAEVFDARPPGVPFVFHFKEAPQICQEHGLWPDLLRVLHRSDGRIFISEENFAWFQLATDGAFDPEGCFILDGDLPKRDWFGDDWAPKLSARDGQIHTVCTGRPLGLDPFAAIAAAGIHVHFYGRQFHQDFPNFTQTGVATGFMHVHPTVEPAEWTRELSRYDAAWVHVFDSQNGGDLHRAHWDDLNLPARLGTCAAAGLPWILRDNHHSTVAIQSLAERHGVGLFFSDPAFGDLAAQLRAREQLARLEANMRAARGEFAFDTHVDDLIAFFHQTIARGRAGRTGGLRPTSSVARSSAGQAAAGGGE